MLPPREMVILQMLHVTAGLLSLFSISTLQTFYPQVYQSNVTCTSAFCHKCALEKTKQKRPCLHVQNCQSQINDIYIYIIYLVYDLNYASMKYNFK